MRALKISDQEAAAWRRHLQSSTPPSKSVARKVLSDALDDRATLLEEIYRLQVGERLRSPWGIRVPSWINDQQ
jgi:hypothetical protein